MKQITAVLEEGIRRWIRQGYTDPSETPLDPYGAEVLREVLVAAGCNPRPATEPPAQPGCCGLCGQPMPPGEEMFKYHGYSGPCPEPPAKGE